MRRRGRSRCLNDAGSIEDLRLLRRWLVGCGVVSLALLKLARVRVEGRV